MSDFLKAEAVVKDYPSGEGTLRVLKGITLEIEPGEILAIVGPSGAGKSTLLHILGFLDRPSSGDIAFQGHRFSQLDRRRQAELRNRNFGFVFQMHHLMPELTALENVMLPLMIRYSTVGWVMAAGGARRRARELLERLGLGPRLNHIPAKLSGGERQRVAIARALAGDPQVVLCDEPTGNLDAASSAEIQKLIAELNGETGKTFVLVTHDASVAALGRRQVRMVDGTLEGGSSRESLDKVRGRIKMGE